MVSWCQQLEQSDWTYVEIKRWIKYSDVSKWHNLKGTKHLVIGQKEGYLKREMMIKRKKYILLGIISNGTLTFLPLHLNSLRFLEFRGSLLTILARLWILSYCKLRRYKLRHNVTPCYPLVTHHSPTHSFVSCSLWQPGIWTARFPAQHDRSQLCHRTGPYSSFTASVVSRWPEVTPQWQ